MLGRRLISEIISTQASFPITLLQIQVLFAIEIAYAFFFFWQVNNKLTALT